MKTLPIDAIMPDIVETVRNQSSVVLQAPTGSGKTTRVPLALLDVIPPEKGKIILLEPRRLAAVSAANWMARILGEETGQTLGYTIRFDSRISKKTRVEVVTEGVFIRRLLADPALGGVAMVIFDEFHERSLDADLALALCLDVRNGLRDDLKLLVMSATLSSGPVAALLGHAPILSAGGETFPVEERHRGTLRDGHPLERRVADTVSTALQETAGDILVFLPGIAEIRRTVARLQERVLNRGGNVSLHPLYGDLPFEEQQRAIQPPSPGWRKIVLATNIAETSLTIEGVRVVIDSGLTRTLRYDPATGMNRLVTVPVSRAAALQRKGRAGRLGPGICYRLYSLHDFASLLAFTPPEIMMSDLSALVLELASWGVTDPRRLSWLDPPPDAAWQAARNLLFQLGALDDQGMATSVGRDIARFPVHPRLGRMLVKAADHDCGSLGADLAALLSERDIFRRSDATKQGGWDISERLERLDAWRKTNRSPRYADPWGVHAVDRVSRQLRQMVGSSSGDPTPENMNEIPRLLLSAYPDRVAKRRDGSKNGYLLASGRGVRMIHEGHPAGSLFIVAPHVDAGDGADGTVHLAEPVAETLLRQDMGVQIEQRRRATWDRRENKILSLLEERLGALTLSAKPIVPEEHEAMPILCEAIRSGDALLSFGHDARQLQGRVDLMRRIFPEESWPDLSERTLRSVPESWLTLHLKAVRTQEQLAALDIAAALQACLSWEQRQMLEKRAPVFLAVPSGRRVALDYAMGDIPVLAVKLQEMFGLADTPAVAGGRVKVLLHLLSPARRPLQITQDLKGFWDGSYHQVKKELRGRYPRHPWPDDPWNAVPTSRAKPRGA